MIRNFSDCFKCLKQVLRRTETEKTIGPHARSTRMNRFVLKNDLGDTASYFHSSLRPEQITNLAQLVLDS